MPEAQLMKMSFCFHYWPVYPAGCILLAQKMVVNLDPENLRASDSSVVPYEVCDSSAHMHESQNSIGILCGGEKYDALVHCKLADAQSVFSGTNNSAREPHPACSGSCREPAGLSARNLMSLPQCEIPRGCVLALFVCKVNLARHKRRIKMEERSTVH